MEQGRSQSKLAAFGSASFFCAVRPDPGRRGARKEHTMSTLSTIHPRQALFGSEPRPRRCPFATITPAWRLACARA